MAEPFGQLRVVPPGELPPPPTRRRRPGPAVLLVLAYGAVFGGGLWLIRARTQPRPAAGARPPNRPGRPAAPPPAIPPDRAALLAGAGVSAAVRPAYFARLAGERCTCGCNLSVHDCLERDRTCARSPEIARRLRASIE